MPSLQDADLSPLGVKRRGMVAVSQRTILKIDEKGAELAVISSGNALDKNVEERDTVRFDLNRPFLYHLRNNLTGAFLIGGAVVKF